VPLSAEEEAEAVTLLAQLIADQLDRAAHQPERP
jgi:hypothetical protein